jgi:DNA-binding beta-propeller fold protein YncE
VDQASNEVYVADGYRNRRVLVLDADTLAFKRMWGAYGNRPEDADIGPYNPDAPPAQQFRTPHNVIVSKDGFVYVADRANNRVQTFRKDGTFVKEGFISDEPCLPAPHPASHYSRIRSSASCTSSTARTVASGSCCVTPFRPSAVSVSRACPAER